MLNVRLDREACAYFPSMTFKTFNSSDSTDKVKLHYKTNIHHFKLFYL